LDLQDLADFVGIAANDDRASAAQRIRAPLPQHIRDVGVGGQQAVGAHGKRGAERPSARRILERDEIDRARDDRGRRLEIRGGSPEQHVRGNDRGDDHACGASGHEDRAAGFNGEMIFAERDRIARAEPRARDACAVDEGAIGRVEVAEPPAAGARDGFCVVAA